MMRITSLRASSMFMALWLAAVGAGLVGLTGCSSSPQEGTDLADSQPDIPEVSLPVDTGELGDATTSDTGLDVAEPDSTDTGLEVIEPDTPADGVHEDVSSDAGADITELPVAVEFEHRESPGSAKTLDALATDVDGDGRDDLVGLEEGGLVFWRVDDASPRPPLSLSGPWRLAALHTGSQLRAGDFDGNGFVDLAVYDASAGKVWVFLHVGAPMSFENPVIAFENPVIAFENPIISRVSTQPTSASSWEVADFDRDGRDDFAFFAGENGVSIGWSRGASSASGLPLLFELAQPAGLSDFENPIIARPIAGAAVDLQGEVGLAIAYDLDGSNDGLTVFSVTAGATFENPIIALGAGAWVYVPDGVRHVVADDLNGDGATDLAWAGVAGTTTDYGVWFTDGFENPIIATSPSFFSHGAPSQTLSSGLLLLSEPLGVGAGGADALANLQSVRHLLFGGEAPFAVALSAPDQSSPPLGLEVEAAAFDAVVDLNGDGFSELLDVHDMGLSLIEQATLSGANYASDVFTLADGSTIPMCELVTAPCAEGSLGVCALARETCGVCTGSAEFVATYGGTFDTIYEPVETACGLLDTNCDGVVGVLERSPWDFTSVGATGERHVMTGLWTGAIWAAIPAAGNAIQAGWLDSLESPTLPTMSTSTVLSGGPAGVRIHGALTHVGILGTDGAQPRLAIVDHTGIVAEKSATPQTGGDTSVRPTSAFGDWYLVDFASQTATVGVLELIDLEMMTANTPVSTLIPIPGLELLAAQGSDIRLYTLLTSDDGAGGAELVWESWAATGAPQSAAIPLATSAAGFAEAILHGNDATQCAAFVEGTAERRRLGLRTLSVTIGPSDLLAVAGSEWDAATDRIAPGTLAAQVLGTDCAFRWATDVGGGSLALHLATLKATGEMSYHYRGSVALGTDPANRFSWLTGPNSYGFWSDASTPERFESALFCPAP